MHTSLKTPNFKKRMGEVKGGLVDHQIVTILLILMRHSVSYTVGRDGKSLQNSTDKTLSLKN